MSWIPYGANFYEFDKLPAIRQYFSYQNFPCSYLLTADKFVAIQLQSKKNYITDSEAPSLENHNIQSSLSHYNYLANLY